MPTGGIFDTSIHPALRYGVKPQFSGVQNLIFREGGFFSLARHSAYCWRAEPPSPQGVVC
jgi:hypothetical protein